MKVNKEEDGIPNQNQNQNQIRNRNLNQTSTGTRSKGKSCKGCLYYSSIRQSKSQNPTCVGFTRTLQQVPSYAVRDSELKASKENRGLTEFKYSCVGYSVHLEKKDTSTDLQEKQAELPFCVGIEFLLGTRPANAEVPSRVHKREDGETAPQPRTYTPAHSPWDEFVSRFGRNAGVVAFGVAKNASRVGNRIKNSLDNILYPYGRRPK